jgi:pyrroloquinoline quinone biosynthesis protein E
MKLNPGVKIRREKDGIMYFNPETADTTILSEKAGISIIEKMKGGNPQVPEGFVRHLFKSGFLQRNSSEEETNSSILTLQELIETEPPATPLRSLSAPETVHISISKTCNQTCSGCFYSYSGLSDDEAFLKMPLYKKAIRQASEMKVFQVAIGGGEPLLHDDFDEIIGFANDHDILPSITTNGTLVDKKMLDILKSSGYGQLQFSLNGSTSEINELTRPNYKKVRDAIKLTRESGVRFGINFLITAKNINDIQNTAELAAREGAHTVNILRAKPDVRDTDWLQKETPGRSVYKNLVEKIRSAQAASAKINPLTKITIDGSMTFILVPYYTPEQLHRMGAWGCSAGRRFLTINADGHVLPCSHVDLWDEKHADIKKAWFESKSFERFRKLEETLRGKCQRCLYKPVCKGCRDVARSYLGTIEDEDPECPNYVPLIMK